MRSVPPAYPRMLPSAPMTRWHGRMISSGFAAIAAPRAWILSRGTPRYPASSPYVMVVPYGMESSAFQTRCWNAVPRGAAVTAKTVSSPAKYASSWLMT